MGKSGGRITVGGRSECVCVISRGRMGGCSVKKGGSVGGRNVQMDKEG